MTALTMTKSEAAAAWDRYIRDLHRAERAHQDRATEMRNFGQCFTAEVAFPTPATASPKQVS